MIDRRLSVAPMMACTDRHERFFLRLLTRRTLLYTEMVVTGALIHGDAARFLAHDPVEHPIAVQLGGADPLELARCARLAEAAGFDEVNLNCGCPSDRVHTGGFGACLMKDPAGVARCVDAMCAAVTVPVTVKMRIGVDDRDSYQALAEFVDTVSQAGCRTFIVHARKVWLQGLSPRENRSVPPLRYDVVRQLKRDFPSLQIIINGGITSLDQAHQHLRDVDGVMMGRAAYHDPYVLADADRVIFGEPATVPSRDQVVAGFMPYLADRLAQGVPLARMTRHILGLYKAQPGARGWRRHLSGQAHRPGAGMEVVREALRYVQADPPDSDVRGSAFVCCDGPGL